jgi:hypothetical protein
MKMMKRFFVPPEWRYPLLGLLAMLVAGNRFIPTVIMGGVLLVLAILQGVQIWQRLGRTQRSQQVTYWRGVRYEVPRSTGRIGWRDIQPELLWIVLCGLVGLTGVSLLLRWLGL